MFHVHFHSDIHRPAYVKYSGTKHYEFNPLQLLTSDTKHVMFYLHTEAFFLMCNAEGSTEKVLV